MSETSLYPCHGVHSSLAKGKASGQLRVGSSHLIFTIADQQIELSLNELKMEQGGASDRLVFFTHPGRPDWRFYTSDKSVLKDPHFKQYPHLAGMMRGARSKHLFNWSLLVVVLLVCLAVPIAALMNLHRASAVIAEQVPVEWEQQLGESSFAQYQISAELMDDEQSARLLEPLVTPLIDLLPKRRFDYHFYIVNDSNLNAFALPGGIVVINSGLILAADDAAELLGVVGHEIVHVRERHGIRNVISHAGIYVAVSALIGDVSGVLAVVADAAPLLISQGYSRDFESEADRLSHALLIKANIDPTGLARFFQKMQAKEQEKLAELGDEDTQEWIKTGMGFISSHPATDERINALEDYNSNATSEFLDLSQPFARLKAGVEGFVVDDDSQLELNESGVVLEAGR
ncbi:M48 family metallopeptidase [Corallincola luteus]|uniref:M48 family metallopeptidase n=1 Tax=Corallincola luteus TaxID=1775177 RepID=A0ABY2AHC2_9GAMM|nr:M48 family metallopeptidase [Corallincola luteus]TCI02007.1 M48 family metallopeptidase [Corallincola luteus]